MIEAKIYERDRALFESLKTLSEDDRKALAVAVVPFNLRAARAIRRLRINTLGQLQQLTRLELISQPGLGLLSYQQVAFYMAELGLPLRETETAPRVETVDQESPDQLIEQIRSLLDRLEARLHAV